MEQTFPVEQLDAARLELASFRRDAHRNKPSDFGETVTGNADLVPTLLMVIALELREMRGLIYAALTQEAAPAECDHPIDLRINESRMGQQAYDQFLCQGCGKRFLHGQEIK